MKNSIQVCVAICLAFLLMPIAALAQQALGGGSKIVSPEIHDNNTDNIVVTNILFNMCKNFLSIC